MTTENKGFKLLEEKIEKMISLVQELRKEREELKGKLEDSEQQIEKLSEELGMHKGSGPGILSLPDVKELLEVVQEERTTVRDSLRGALRLINE